VTPSPSRIVSGCTFPPYAVAYWDFNESSGTFIDKIGGYVGTGSGILYNTSGKLNRCVGFDTITDYLTVPNNIGFVPSSDKYSISLWFKINVLPSISGRSYELVRLWDNTSSYSAFQVELPSDGNYVSFTIFNSAGTEFGVKAQIPTVGFTTNVWYNVVCVNYGNGIPGIVYINGIDRTYWRNATFTGSMIKATGTLRIGNSSSSGYSAINGYIDELALWNRPLTAYESVLIYNNGNALPYCKQCLLNPTVDIIY
jgi:hypothetical protein